MKDPLRLVRIGAVLVAVVLVAAACSGSSGDPELAPLAPDTAEPTPLPPSDNPDATPGVAAVCAPDFPDCIDTVVIDREPQALPDTETLPPAVDPEPVTPADSGPITSGGMLVDGGLTVPDALSTDATGLIAVQGHFFDDGTGARLCEVLAESFPPQCGGASIPLSGHEDVIETVLLVTTQGVTWTDAPVSLLGEIIEGTLVVVATVAG